MADPVTETSFQAGGVFWLSYVDPAAIPAEAAACGGRDGLNLSPNFETLYLPAQVRLVQSAWRSPLPRLLVFDNWEEEVPRAEWRPPTGGCRVLVTSRLCINLGYHLEMIGDYAGAHPYYEQAVSIAEAVFGESQSQTATSLNNLGSLL